VTSGYWDFTQLVLNNNADNYLVVAVPTYLIGVNTLDCVPDSFEYNDWIPWSLQYNSTIQTVDANVSHQYYCESLHVALSRKAH
jgi:hypothetical protein